MSNVQKLSSKVQKMSPDFRRKRVAHPKITNRRNAAAIILIERRYRVVSLRRDGYTVAQIAAELGMDVNTVRNDLTEILDNTIIKYQETVEQARQIQLEQLDQLQKTYTPFAVDVHKERMTLIDGTEVVVTKPPDPIYGKLLLDIISRRSRLMAIDMPEQKKIELTGVRAYIGVDPNDV